MLVSTETYGLLGLVILEENMSLKTPSLLYILRSIDGVECLSRDESSPTYLQTNRMFESGIVLPISAKNSPI